MEDIYTTQKKYQIIYADPPWAFKVWSEKGKGRSAESHYPIMQKKEIQDLPIKRIASKAAVLFLWVTAPCLIEGIELIKAWEFTYKTVAFTWIKQNKKNDGFLREWAIIRVQMPSSVCWRQRERYWNGSRIAYRR